MMCIDHLWAWSPPMYLYQQSSRQGRLIFLATHEGEDGESDKIFQDNTNQQSTAVYGVSYIGGDPCGSKYNDDPFDATSTGESFKPGLPDNMKDRIEAMAARKLQEEKERKGK